MKQKSYEYRTSVLLYCQIDSRSLWTRGDHLLHDKAPAGHTFPFLSARKISKPPLLHRQKNKKQKKIKTNVNLLPIGSQSGPGNLLASLWSEITIWQHAGCPEAGSLVAVAAYPERDILFGL